MTNEAPAIFSVVPPTENHEDLPLPENGPYFIWTKKGWFVHRMFHWGRLLNETEGPHGIPEMTPFIWSDIKLPIEVVGQAWSFFRSIWETKKSEAMVDITWSEERGYRLFVPPQKASQGGVKATRNTEHYKGQIVGTIHSHCNFGAFHSGTDTHDADGHDGLHITLGKVDKNPPEIAIMIMMGKKRWDYKPEELWEDPKIPLVAHPVWWEKQVGPPETSTYGKYSPAKTSSGMAIVPYQKPKSVSGIVLPGGPRTIKTSIPTYNSIDELLWRRQDALTQADELHLDAINGYIDDITQALDMLGFDFDYSVVTQVNNQRLTPSEDIRREDLDDYFNRAAREMYND